MNQCFNMLGCTIPRQWTPIIARNCLQKSAQTNRTWHHVVCMQGAKVAQQPFCLASRCHMGVQPTIVANCHKARAHAHRCANMLASSLKHAPCITDTTQADAARRPSLTSNNTTRHVNVVLPIIIPKHHCTRPADSQPTCQYTCLLRHPCMLAHAMCDIPLPTLAPLRATHSIAMHHNLSWSKTRQELANAISYCLPAALYAFQHAGHKLIPCIVCTTPQFHPSGLACTKATPITCTILLCLNIVQNQLCIG